MPLTSHGSRDPSEVHEPGVHLASATTLSTGLKHTRQRSNSWGATFYTSTLVPAQFHSEALSSLISSLTSISDAQKAATDTQRPTTGSPPSDDDAAVLISRLADHPDLQRAFSHDKTVPTSWSENEQDVCPPPVAGYNTINADTLPGRPKTAGAEGPSLKLKIKKARGALRSSQSQGNIRRRKSRRTLKTPDSNSSVPPHPRSSHGDDSVYSVALSTNSKQSTSKNSFKMFFSSRVGSDHHHHHPHEAAHEGLPKKSGSSFDAPPSLPEKEPDARRFSAFVAVSRISTDTERKDANGRTVEPMSPSLRTDLSENLIPSRRSSLRGGHGQRSSRSSRDLRRLDIDQDLIEENNETVQRIRELQEARERRHHEWRRDAARSENPLAKRGSMPSANSSPSKRAGSVRSSWRPTMLDTPEDEDPPQLSASILGSDLPDMPAYADAAGAENLTPVEREKPAAEESDLRRKLSLTGSITPSLSSTKRHRKRFSDSIRRASLRSPMPDDAKGIAEEVESYLSSPRLTQKIRHPRTGRTIAFSEVGDPDGFVVFCCVGMGLTRYVSSFYDDIARTHRLRIITPDRPGVGETDALPQERAAPLSWVDDVAVICTSLAIEKFSLLAHSAGAIYALAAALKMPQYVRGRIHLLSPWIPPSVLAASGRQGDVKAVNLPTAHKLLSILPASFMKAANSRFLSATSASIEPRILRDGKKDRAPAADLTLDDELFNQEASLSTADFTQGNMFPTPDATPNQPSQNLSCYQAEQMHSPQQSPTPGSLAPPRSQTFSPTSTSFSAPGTRASSRNAAPPALTPEARQKLYNTTLAHRTWSLATLNANPAGDLITCLERKKPIGFRYTDITRAVVIHHGANDTRVPLENVRWLSAAMKRCELRVLDAEGHGLMASASVMANVLAEIGKEWEEWNHVVQEKEKERKRRELAEKEEARERERAFRRGYPRW